uniref:Protein kinase domain-containing protein n=1 Tax=Acrobeloides nanus TaxID=290746 RepID=A0A914C460_9BILA
MVAINDTAIKNNSRSGSKTKTPSRYSLSKIRRTGGGSSSGGAGSSCIGGEPLESADPNILKRDIKHRFEITKRLGSGTYGKVSLAFDHKTEREVAVKLIKKSAIENKQDLIRIRREIRIMSALKHPNIIQIYEVFENKDKIILVMEYASGGELYDHVSKHGSLPESEARRIFRQITSAVLYCHKHKVAHRDLKLENILLDIDSNAKIADFGLSNYFNEKTFLSTFCGSPLYASPEIINGTPYKGPEVDCWSLGILLYTLVYGSMPFDGRDFNRMVRQIKRGAYYEPDTPSTASMLIRNMLRVNPDRRADIDEIASHWWLNLEENMPVIQELPENQITDHTPLTERAETMVVQDLADETDVFMEFGHLSSETRKKIEEFRRRRKEAEEYNENSPIKPPKTPRTDGQNIPELTSKEKSLRNCENEELKKQSEKNNENPNMIFADPLERLKQLETRLGVYRKNSQAEAQSQEENKNIKQQYAKNKKELEEEKPPQAIPNNTNYSKTDKNSNTTPTRTIVSSSKENIQRPSNNDYMSNYNTKSRNLWNLESDSLNLLMNQVLEQMEKGPVSMNLIARIKAHPQYDQRPMVKELLESIIEAQPTAVKKEASKIIQQQSQEIIKRQISNNNIENKKLPDIVPSQPYHIKGLPPMIGGNPQTLKYQVQELPPTKDVNNKASHNKASLEERPWHSVEVGFETDEDSDQNDNLNNETSNIKSTKNEQQFTTSRPLTTIKDTKQQDNTTTHSSLHYESKSDGDFIDEEDENDFKEELDEEEDEEEYESEIDELAEVVEQVTKSTPFTRPPTIITNKVETLINKDVQEISSAHLSAFDRGLAKRQSKGKYQVSVKHNQVELYGRGVSMETDSPPLTKKRIGGPQPPIDHSPILFDKAKRYIEKYPEKIEDSNDEIKKEEKKAGSKWLQSQDPDIADKSASVTPTPSHGGSVPPRDPPTIKSEEESINDEDESEEEEEEEEDDIQFRPKQSTIIGFRTINALSTDGSKKEAPIVQVKPQSQKISPDKTQQDNSQGYTLDDINSTKPNNSLKNDFKKETNSSEYKSDEDNESELNGIQKWESAAAYIRRKNRERRLRNRTIGAPEEAIHRSFEMADHNDNIRVKADEKSIYQQEFDKNIIKIQEYQPRRKLSNTNATKIPSDLLDYKLKESAYYHQAQINRRKSFSEINPNYEDDVSSYESNKNTAYSRTNYPPVAAISFLPSRFEDEIQNHHSMQNWVHEPKKFEVYRTRAERAAEMNTTNFGYRTNASNYAERPYSSYTPGSYNQKNEDNYAHRRFAYDVDRSVTPVSEYMQSHITSSSHNNDDNSFLKEANLMSHYRPVTRRMESTRSDIRSRARSQSSERKMNSLLEIDRPSNL